MQLPCRGNEMLVERDLFKLEREGRRGADETYLRLLRECGRSGLLAQGKRVHRLVSAMQLDGELRIANGLMRMYLECGSLQGAHIAFSAMDKGNVDSWNSGIAAFAQNGHLDEAFYLFYEMEENTVSPSRITYTTLLNALDRYPSSVSLAAARELHHGILREKKKLKQKGLHLFIGTSLVNVYGKCGSLDEAKRVFDGMFVTDVALWSSMIAAYAHAGHTKKALVFFRKMLLGGTKPNPMAFVNALNAIREVESLQDGQKLHSLVVEAMELNGNVLVATALISMYGRCKCIEEAISIFDNLRCCNDVVLWNAMIAAYARLGHSKAAVHLFERMTSARRMKPNRNTIVTLLGAFDKPEPVAASSLSFIRQEILKRGLDEDVVVSTALISAYGKCGMLDEATEIFDALGDRKNSVTWRTMISTYDQNKQRRLPQKMQQADQAVFISPKV